MSTGHDALLMQGRSNICIGPGAGDKLTTASFCIGIGRDTLKDVKTEDGVIDIHGVIRHDPELAKALVPILRALIHDAGKGLQYVIAHDELAASKS